MLIGTGNAVGFHRAPHSFRPVRATWLRSRLAAVSSARILRDFSTPFLVLDADRLDRNADRMLARLQHLGVRARPHVKTCKSLPVVQRMLGGAVGPVTVSTLAEAEHCFTGGHADVLYAVGIAPGKLVQVLALRARGCDLTVVVDSVEAAAHVAAAQAAIPTLIEVDSDGHRAGIRADDPQLLKVARKLTEGARLRGVMTHAGASYACRSAAAIAAMAEQERCAVVEAAQRLRADGHDIAIVSAGSTPTAMFAERLDGVTEMRTGVHVFMDLVMAGLGVCTIEDIALSVAVSVIGHQRTKPRLITDGGWMALSRDRSTAAQAVDHHYGVVCDVSGRPLEELVVADTNQEHGIIARRDGEPFDVDRFPIGAMLRILPNHACATAAQHDRYRVVRGGEAVQATWTRFSGW